MEIKRKISFKIRAIGKNRDIYQIRMRVSYNSHRIDFKTGCSLVDKSFWDDLEGRARDGYKGPRGETTLSINNELRNYRDQMEYHIRLF